MATRDIWILQEDATGKFVRVLLSPTAAQQSLSFNALGVPVVTAATAPIAAAAATSGVTAASAVAPSVGYVQAEHVQMVTDLNAAIANLNLVRTDVANAITKLNSLLAAARTHNFLQT